MTTKNPASLNTVYLEKVLVANRGEIARRIFRTLEAMGIVTVAVYSDVDREAPHVREADEAVRIGPAPTVESYLDIDGLIAAAQTVGAQAIHPGYGFLAENADFAERCAAAGIVFIGPPPAAIRTMGDKAKAKKIAVAAKVPTVDGFELDGVSDNDLLSRAAELGYPLMVKAVAGGGGKGMRSVEREPELLEAIAAAGREAEAAFADNALLIERKLEAPRHIEIQIFGDRHGRVVHLGERDCSVQRRHQKVIEESPSPAVDRALRRRMGEAAITIARAVDYVGAGTVEFLLDASGNFFFLEMNTRLQVEHPVTEEISGIDLVRLQIEVAQGASLSILMPEGQEQSDAEEAFEIERCGHAIEARLYAESAAPDYLPSTGTLALWSEPSLAGLRIDSGVDCGMEVGVHYDPMLAKLIAHGRDRTEALAKLQRGLQGLAVAGVETNRELLLATLASASFRSGRYDTSILATLPPQAVRTQQPCRKTVTLQAAAATVYLHLQRRRQPTPVPRSIPSGWRNNRWRPQQQQLTHRKDTVTVSYTAHADDRFELQSCWSTDGTESAPATTEQLVRTVRFGNDELIAEVDGIQQRFQFGRQSDSLFVHAGGYRSEFTVVPRFPVPKANTIAGGCVAPMTGRIRKVLVKEGDTVTAGTPLAVLEAMKMEHQLTALSNGTVTAVRIEEGQMVDPDDVLVVVAPKEVSDE